MALETRKRSNRRHKHSSSTRRHSRGKHQHRHQQGRGLIEGALVAGILAAGATSVDRKGSVMDKSVKKLAKSLEAVSEATEDVVKGTIVVPETLLKSVVKRSRGTRKAGRR